MRSVCALIVVAACLSGCRSDDVAGTPSATVATAPATTAPSTTTTVPLTPDQEVEAAYLKSWEVYADALLRLDGSRFPEVYVDDALVMRNEELADLARANTPVRIAVEHNYEIALMEGADQALVTEDYMNHSVLLDGKSMRPIEQDPAEILAREYQLRKVGPLWLVESARSRS